MMTRYLSKTLLDSCHNLEHHSYVPFTFVIFLYVYSTIIKQVALNKLSLLLDILLQNTQTLQLNQNGKYLQK
jgi:hypothetical protein